MTNYQREHKNKIDYGTVQYYLNFKKRYSEIDINQMVHTKIIKTFFSIVLRKITLEMFRFDFTGLGLFYLVKRKYKVVVDEEGKLVYKIPTNWKETNKVRELTGDNTKRVIYLNNHTNGYIYKLRWNRWKVRFKNRHFYSFIPAKPTRQYINKQILSNIKPLNAYIL